MASITQDVDVRRAHEADASGLRMLPDAVARPQSDAEVLDVLARATAERTPVTPAGAQSSTTGASITERGILLSMRGYDRIVDIDPTTRVARVQAGALIADVHRAAGEFGLTWAPDPTSESEATVGGAIACNASGPRTLLYGPTRRHVNAVRVALPDGRVIEARRSDVEKNTAGYAMAQEPLDWFIGSEGTLGVVLDAELRLVERPARVIGLMVPFGSEAQALAFVHDARASAAVAPRCLEYLDASAAAIALAAGDQSIASLAGAALVYTEQAVDSEADETRALEAWLSLAEAQQAWADDVQVLADATALTRVRTMRHAVPSTMNERGSRARANGGRRVSTDWAVPYQKLSAAVSVSRAIAERHGVGPAVTFGHAGNGHPHQNYIARNAEELVVTERVVEETLREVVAMGGTIAAEHGIGKIKRRWLGLQVTPLQLGVMRALKRELDPLELLAPGNLF